jgi:hypothetical protein
VPLRRACGQLRGVRIDDRRDCPARHRLHRGAQPRCIVSAGGLGAAPVTARGRASPAGSVLVCGRLPKALRRPGSPGLASPAAALRSSARPVHARASGRAAPSHTGASLSPRQSPCPGPLWGEPVVAGTGSARDATSRHCGGRHPKVYMPGGIFRSRPPGATVPPPYRGEREFPGDARVRHACGQQCQHLQLADGQLLDRTRHRRSAGRPPCEAASAARGPNAAAAGCL